MRDLRTVIFVGLVAFAAMVLGCGDDGESNEPGAIPGPGPNASATPDRDRAEGHVAFKVSGMKKTASGAT